jgi:heme/copper-type cytochrome/quinol oxidase subunit 3
MTSTVSLPQRDLTRPTSPIPSAVFGTLVFVGAELMFFMGLISAYLVIKAGVNNWVPPESVRLPVMATAFNTLVLLLSGLTLFVAGRQMKEEGPSPKVMRTYLVALLLGAFFVIFQGYEWVRLVSYGMTMTSSIFGACFFLLIGSHGVHALGALLAMAWFYRHLSQGKLTREGLMGIQVFWFFVVGIWPILYGLVYF